MSIFVSILLISAVMIVTGSVNINQRKIVLDNKEVVETNNIDLLPLADFTFPDFPDPVVSPDFPDPVVSPDFPEIEI